MSVFYLIVCLSVANVMARPEPPSDRTLFSNVHAAKPHVYQQLPHEHTFADFLMPSTSYGVPIVSLSHDIKDTDFGIPTEDSYKSAFVHSSSQQHQTGYDHGPTETQIHKHIYVHVPPKDFEQEDAIQPRVIHQTAPKQKHYKIVFIKAPEAPSYRLPAAPALPQNEEKTLIYVLHKRPEAHPDIVIPTPEATKPSKPEVYFIKYNSKREEAPVYGPPPAYNGIQARSLDENDVVAGNNFASISQPQNAYELTTQQPQYDTKTFEEHAQSRFDIDQSSVESYTVPTESYLLNEEVVTTTSQPLNQYLPPETTTAQPLNQYLPPETTLAPIVVKDMNETSRIPTIAYGAPKRNRFFIKRRK